MKHQALTCLLIDDSRQEVSGFYGINDRPAFALITPDLEGTKYPLCLKYIGSERAIQQYDEDDICLLQSYSPLSNQILSLGCIGAHALNCEGNHA
jgi:hypothetical protein